jgi:hypothetical protein
MERLQKFTAKYLKNEIEESAKGNRCFLTVMDKQSFIYFKLHKMLEKIKNINLPNYSIEKIINMKLSTLTEDSYENSRGEKSSSAAEIVAKMMRSTKSKYPSESFEAYQLMKVYPSIFYYTDQESQTSADIKDLDDDWFKTLQSHMLQNIEKIQNLSLEEYFDKFYQDINSQNPSDQTLEDNYDYIIKTSAFKELSKELSDFCENSPFNVVIRWTIPSYDVHRRVYTADSKGRPMFIKSDDSESVFSSLKSNLKTKSDPISDYIFGLEHELDYVSQMNVKTMLSEKGLNYPNFYMVYPFDQKNFSHEVLNIDYNSISSLF